MQHLYNAKSGIVITIGQKRVKFSLWIHNKYCTAYMQGIPVENHTCFKIWKMETDIIPESFQNAEKIHGIHYLQFIGYGDS